MARTTGTDRVPEFEGSEFNFPNEVGTGRLSLHQPSLHEIKYVLKDALDKVFTEVSVNVVECPDLKREPFYLAQPGLCGNAQALEIGTVCNRFPINGNKTWFLPAVLDCFYNTPPFVIGGGLRYEKPNCNEYISNFTYLGRCTIYDKSQIIFMNDAGMYKSKRNLELICDFFGNFFMSNGMIEDVLEVRLKQRKANINFADVMHLALCKKYGRTTPVGLGGTFYVKNGIVKHDVMLKKFVPSNTCFYPYISPLYDIQSPLVGVGTIYSFKSMVIKPTCSRKIRWSYEKYLFRGQRFYTFSPTGDGGGIYCNDCSPNTIEYHGYFNVATSLLYLDLPIIPIYSANTDM